MKTVALLSLLVPMSFMTTVVWAYPNLDGASGLVIVPTSEVTPKGALDLAVDYSNPGGDWDLVVYPTRINFGISDGLELSGNYTMIEAYPDVIDEAWTIGAKYAFMTEAEDDLGVAVGGSWGTMNTSWGNIDITKLYLALGRAFSLEKDSARPLNLRVTGGLMYRSYDVHYIIDNTPYVEETTGTEPFVGLELVNKDGKSSLGFEYQWRDADIESAAVLSTFGRFRLSDRRPLWLEVGITNGAFLSRSHARKAFIGIAYVQSQQ